MDLIVAIAIMCHVTSNAPMGNVQYAQKQCVADLTKCILNSGGASPSAKLVACLDDEEKEVRNAK